MWSAETDRSYDLFCASLHTIHQKKEQIPEQKLCCEDFPTILFLCSFSKSPNVETNYLQLFPLFEYKAESKPKISFCFRRATRFRIIKDWEEIL